MLPKGEVERTMAVMETIGKGIWKISMMIEIAHLQEESHTYTDIFLITLGKEPLASIFKNTGHY